MTINLICAKTNSGGCAVPRNIGMRFARGEYFMFVDSDDAITKTAVADIYKAALKFDADMLYCERWFEVDTEDKLTAAEKILKGTPFKETGFVSKPTFESDSLNERVLNFSKKFYWGYAWLYLYRRDLIMENELQFPNTKGEDQFFAFCALCFAKKILRVPYINNFYRIRSNSISKVYRSTQDMESVINTWVNTAMCSIELLDKFMNQLEFFKNEPRMKYSVFERFFIDFTPHLLQAYAQIPPHQLDELIRREFEKFDVSSALTTFLFSRMNMFNVNLIRQQNIIQQQQAYIQQLQAQLQGR